MSILMTFILTVLVTLLSVFFLACLTIDKIKKDLRKNNPSLLFTITRTYRKFNVFLVSKQ